jgi:hypothetical protein
MGATLKRRMKLAEYARRAALFRPTGDSVSNARRPRAKVFCFFFTKKKFFLNF